MKSIFHHPDIKEILQRTRALLRDNLLDKDLRCKGNLLEVWAEWCFFCGLMLFRVLIKLLWYIEFPHTSSEYPFKTWITEKIKSITNTLKRDECH